MKISITKDKSLNILYKLAAIAFWLVLWQVLAVIIDNALILVSPIDVAVTLFKLLGTANFWRSVGGSFWKITLGFIVSLIAGILLAAAAYNSRIVREILAPVIGIINATPVVSFIILVIFLVAVSANIPIIISFLMVLPVVYTNMLTGLLATDRKLLEMSKVFKVRNSKKIKYIYLPGLMPHFASACNVGLGICWKSGIAAELIALCKNTIGWEIYSSKVFLQMKELLAWTVVIIILSTVFRKVFMLAVNLIKKRIEGN